MLHPPHPASAAGSRFDLAPTGALCYNLRLIGLDPHAVLISLPQERCATLRLQVIERCAQF